jgi:hypothetical protein
VTRQQREQAGEWGKLVPVSNAELRHRAAELGVSVSYWDWRGQEVVVPDETLTAIVAALEDAPPADGADRPPDAVAPAHAAPGATVTCETSPTSPPGRPASSARGSC